MDSWHRLYKHPKWFAKRNKILDRDGRKCTVCGSKKNLCVHHTYYYTEDTPPWGYPDDCYLTLCKEHHEEWHIWHELVYIPKPVVRKKKRKKQKGIEYKSKTLAGKVAEKKAREEQRKKYCLINGKRYRL